MAATPEDLAFHANIDERWAREWLAQQAAAGFVKLLPGTGDSRLRFRLKRAYADVLADPNHEEYDISLVRMVPALVQRAREDGFRAFELQRAVGVRPLYTNARRQARNLIARGAWGWQTHGTPTRWCG